MTSTITSPFPSALPFPLLWLLLIAAISLGLLTCIFYVWYVRKQAFYVGKLSALTRDNGRIVEDCGALQDEVEQLREVQLTLRAENSALSTRLELEFTRRQEKKTLLEQTRESMGKEFENLANRIFDNKQQVFSQVSKDTLLNTVDPLRKDLLDFRKKVEDAYDKESAERNRLVGKIGELQAQTQKIGDDALKLAGALKGDNKFQGDWGEHILERLLEASGLSKGRDYETQVSLFDEQGQRRNPDVILHLPDQRDIVIDAKVSLKDYERYCRSDDDPAREKHLNAHIASIQAHIKGLSRKAYEQLEGVETLDFVLIFVPVEAAFMLAIEHEHDLFSQAYDRGIILVSPTTLLATLRTIDNIWRYADRNRNAEKIAAQAGALYDQFMLMLEGLETIGKHIDKSQDAWHTTRKRLISGRGNLLKRVEDLKVLGANTRRKVPLSMGEESKLDDERLVEKSLSSGVLEGD